MSTPYPLAERLYPSIRQSVLQSFDNCALLSRFEREMRAGWSHPWQARGTIFHRFAARALETMYREQEEAIPVGEALAILMEVLRQHDVDRECPSCHGNRIRKGVSRMGLRACLDCGHKFETEIVVLPQKEVDDLYWVTKKWAKDNRWSIANLIDVEQQLGATIEYPNPDGGWVTRRITGKLDTLLIEGEQAEHAIILDWKDMWGMPAESAVSKLGYFQQRFYGYLVMINYRSVQAVTTREFYVRFSEPRETTIYRKDLDDIEQELSALVERFDRAVEERLYIPSPGKHCGYCPTPQRCPIPKQAREEGAITNPEEAALAAATILVAETTIEKRKRALKAWCENHGPVEVKNAKGKTMMGFEATTKTYSPKPAQIEQAVRENGGPLTEAQIKALYRTVSGTRFGAFTPSAQLEDDEDAVLLEQFRAAAESALV